MSPASPIAYVHYVLPLHLLGLFYFLLPPHKDNVLAAKWLRSDAFKQAHPNVEWVQVRNLHSHTPLSLSLSCTFVLRSKKTKRKSIEGAK